MKAMILAAGLGTRLRPLTNDRPKALVEVAGRTMLEIALERLRHFGVSEVIINTHYFADMIGVYLSDHNNFGMRLEVSREKVPLDTGGGLKAASWFFLEDDRDEPFILHNVDVLSNIDLERMVRFHAQNEALATLAVQERATSRYLLFDQNGLLCGRRNADTTTNRAAGSESKDELVRPTQETDALAFSGIHVVSPRIFSMMREEGAFSIVQAYLRLAAQGEKILAFRADDYKWRDLGRPEDVAQAAREIQDSVPSQA
jgi:NDP-sugar pyrophosphorylase family protein